MNDGKQGTNQTGMRAHNERLILSLLREHKSLAKRDIAKMTGLTAQTSSVIMRELETEDLILRGEPIKGKIGQPVTPMKLNPDGAFFLGLKIGRRSSQLVLIDVLGCVRKSKEITYNYPTPDVIIQFTLDSITIIKKGLKRKEEKRIAGFGIALPFELWNWADEVDGPRKEMESWKTTDIQKILEEKLPYKIYLENDATAACGAELAFGNANNIHDYIYIYIGAFIGGGIVLNGKLFTGHLGNAGALGSMPITRGQKEVKQLIDIASLRSLENKLINNQSLTEWLWESPENWESEKTEIKQWIEEAGQAIAYAIVSSCSVINFEAAIIEGWLPRNILIRLTETISAQIKTFDLQGLQLPEILKGTVGIHSRSIGAASLPLSERFLVSNLTSKNKYPRN